MKFLFTISLIISCLFIAQTLGQSQFSPDAYSLFLQENQNLSFENLHSKFLPQNTYYKGFDDNTPLNEYAYFDSIMISYGLTDQEKELLGLNRFVVTERLDFDCFGTAFHDIYVKDLPVFISTDAILQALHASYDQILIDLEILLLKHNLIVFLDNLYETFPQLNDKYADMDTSLSPEVRSPMFTFASMRSPALSRPRFEATRCAAASSVSRPSAFARSSSISLSTASLDRFGFRARIRFIISSTLDMESILSLTQ